MRSEIKIKIKIKIKIENETKIEFGNEIKDEFEIIWFIRLFPLLRVHPLRRQLYHPYHVKSDLSGPRTILAKRILMSRTHLKYKMVTLYDSVGRGGHCKFF